MKEDQKSKPEDKESQQNSGNKSGSEGFNSSALDNPRGKGHGHVFGGYGYGSGYGY